jgi:hypothetical protein
MKFLLEWNPAVSMIFLCVISIIVSYFVLRIVRRKYSHDTLEDNHEIGGHIFHAFGLIYAVPLAFVVFVTWTEYDDSYKNVHNEASELADLVNDSKAFPEDLRIQVAGAVEEYIKNVKEDEWPAMSEGRVSDKAKTSFLKLWHVYSAIDVTKIKNVPIYQESLKHLNDLGDMRRKRIFDSGSTMPDIVWFVLLFGAVMTVVYTFFFSIRKLANQFFMISALAVINTMTLYVIYILDHPFIGYSRITPEVFDYVLTLIR